MNTYWHLDVDGVLNASKAGWSSAPRSGTAYYGGTAYRMRWAPALMKRIKAIHDSGRVTIVWSTTWVGQTPQLERLFGLPHFDTADSVSMSSDSKFKAAKAVLTAGHRLIWTDDMETPAFGDIYNDWMSTGRALLIRPRSSKGLRPEDIDRIEEFIV